MKLFARREDDASHETDEASAIARRIDRVAPREPRAAHAELPPKLAVTGESGPKPETQTANAPRHPAPRDDQARAGRSTEAEAWPSSRRRAPAPGRAPERDVTPRPVEPTRHLRPLPEAPANDRGGDRDATQDREAAQGQDREVGQARTIEFPARAEDPLGERTQTTRRGPRYSDAPAAAPRTAGDHSNAEEAFVLGEASGTHRLDAPDSVLDAPAELGPAQHGTDRSARREDRAFRAASLADDEMVTVRVERAPEDTEPTAWHGEAPDRNSRDERDGSEDPTTWSLDDDDRGANSAKDAEARAAGAPYPQREPTPEADTADGFPQDHGSRHAGTAEHKSYAPPARQEDAPRRLDRDEAADPPAKARHAEPDDAPAPPKFRFAQITPEDEAEDEAPTAAHPQTQVTARKPTPPATAWRATDTKTSQDDSLLDCLVVMTALFERPHSAEALSAGLPLENGKLTPELFVRGAERAGLSARIVRRSLEEISNLSLPAVLLLEEGKACILVRKRDDGTVAVLLPETGHGVTELRQEALAEQCTGFAIFARPEFQFDARSDATEYAEGKSWFWGTLKRFWRIYAQVGVAALFVNLFALASPLFIMNVYDRVVPTKGQETLWVLVIGVVTIFAFEFVLRNLRSYFVDTAGRSADVIMGSMIFQQILGIRMAARPPSAGAFANQLREFETLRDFFTSATLVTLVDLPFVFLFIGIIFLIGGWVGVVPLVAVPIVIGAGLILQVPLTKIVASSAKESAQKHALLVESIVGLETIKSLGAEGRTQRNWERFVGESSKSSAKARGLSQLAMFITTLTTQLTTVSVVVLGVYMIFEGNMTVGALIACTILTGRAMAPLGQVASILTRFNQSMVSLRTLDTVMRMPVERPKGAHFVHRPDLRGAIEFKDVTFTYPNQQVKALERVSFAVKPGEKVGIIGKIGSGKSTIERLTLGLYQPDEGAIRIDGTDIQQIDPADLRRNIGYVSQDIYLFFGTVRDNIAVGAPHADDAALLRAARISGADNFISKHPHGFDLQIGERGESLSGGQRQSIAIARALVRDPNILILDEPTSAMDKGSEDWFIARMRETLGNKTLIVVTQRVSLLAMVDRLLVMDNGRVVADGPREEVLERLARGQISGATA